MVWSWTRGVLLCCMLIPAVMSQTATDSTTTDLPEACSIIDCSLTTYILIGIAAFYIALSVLCVVLICIACVCCKKRVRSRGKVQAEPINEENELDGMFLPDLEPITEVTTTTELVLENTYTSLTDSGTSGGSSNSSDSESENDTSLVIKNPSARKQKLLRLQKSGGLPADSPLLHHKPKISPIPPSKVRVPYTGDTTEQKTTHEHSHGPVRLPPIRTNNKKLTPRQRRKVAAAALKESNESSPEIRTPEILQFFGHVHKGAQKEVAAQDDEKGTPKMKHVQRLDSRQRPIKNGVLVTESALKFEMVKIAPKWRLVGKAFSIPHITLNSISIINKNETETCMLRVCEEWLKAKKDRDWSELIEILQLESIRETKLADYLYQYYYRAGPSAQLGRSESVEDGIDAEGSLSWID